MVAQRWHPSLVPEDLAPGRLVRPFDLAVPVDECFYFVLPGASPGHPDAAIFRDWLLAKVAGEIAKRSAVGRIRTLAGSSRTALARQRTKSAGSRAHDPGHG